MTELCFQIRPCAGICGLVGILPFSSGLLEGGLQNGSWIITLFDIDLQFPTCPACLTCKVLLR
jgi:hypothetical protein